MVISIDTEIVNQLAALTESADTVLESSMAKFLLVTEHNDWICKERDNINENIEAMREQAKKLQEMMKSFASSMNEVAAAFNSVEASIPGTYAYIDSLVADTAEIIGGAMPGNTGSVTHGVMTQSSAETNLENYAMNNMTSGIKVCNFSDFDLGK